MYSSYNDFILFIFCINKTIVLIFILGLYLKYNIAKLFFKIVIFVFEKNSYKKVRTNFFVSVKII